MNPAVIGVKSSNWRNGKIKEVLQALTLALILVFATVPTYRGVVVALS